MTGATEPGRTRRAPDIAVAVIAVVGVIAFAKWSAEFVVPIVAGFMVAYAVAPLVGGLTRMKVPRGIAATLVLSALVGGLGSTVYSLRNDAADALAELPEAAKRIRETIHISASGAKSPLAHVQKAAAELEKAAAEASGTADGTRTPPAASAVTTELPRELAAHGASLLAVLGQVLIAVTLAFFLLTAGDAYRRKLARIVGPSLARRRLTVEILDQIDVQVQRYLFNMLVTNVLLAAGCWSVYAWMGLGRAGMWATAVGLLHFIPYVGTALAATATGLAALVQTGSLALVVSVVGLTIAISVVLGVGVSTWLQGRASRMNPAAVFISVLFFGWLWGGWGLLLGAPLAAVAKAVAERVEALRPFAELLGEVTRRDAAALVQKPAIERGA